MKGEVEMRKIRITKTPPGFADPKIRAQWVGVEIPLIEGTEAAEAESAMPRSSLSAGGYIVRGEDAVLALADAGKREAAAFWSNPVPAAHLRFARDCCKLIE